MTGFLDISSPFLFLWDLFLPNENYYAGSIMKIIIIMFASVVRAFIHTNTFPCWWIVPLWVCCSPFAGFNRFFSLSLALCFFFIASLLSILLLYKQTLDSFLFPSVRQIFICYQCGSFHMGSFASYNVVTDSVWSV